MSSKNTSEKIVGVIGAGSFGTAIANMLAEKSHVLIYVRDKEKAEKFTKARSIGSHALSEKVEITNDISEVGKRCEIIFPIVPSANFRQMKIGRAHV